MNMYFIAIVLPAELNEKILALKKMMQEKYGCKVGLKSPAHITIAPPFWMHPDLENALQHDMELLSKAVVPFTIATNNFSAFKPRTIFVAVQPNEQLNAVKKTADNFFKSQPQYNVKAEHRPFHPHITIATRDLPKSAFAEAWPLFADKPFEASFSATGLSILRHNTRNWDVVHTSPFEAPETLP